MKNDLLKALLDVGEAFEQQHPEPEQTLERFSAFLSQSLARQPTPGSEGEPTSPPQPSTAGPDADQIPAMLTQHIVMAYRYVRHYARKSLADTPLLTLDDFIVLIILLETGSQTKMELIEATINEKAAGMLVIKRLLNAGFVSQTDDTTDRRSKRVSITPAGRQVVLSILPDMDQVAHWVADGFSPADQQQFLAYLIQFDQRHKPLFLHQKETSLAELIQPEQRIS